MEGLEADVSIFGRAGGASSCFYVMVKMVKQASEREHECLQTPGQQSRVSKNMCAVFNVPVCFVSKNSNSDTKGLVSVLTTAGHVTY